MKILFTLNGQALTTKNGNIENLRKAGHEVIYYNAYGSKSEAYNYQTKHFQMYKPILDLAEEIKADVIFFVAGAEVPEYLFYELQTRPNFKPKIIMTMIFRGFDRSLARSLAMKDLVDMSQIIMVPTTGLISSNVTYPENLDIVGFDYKKLYVLHEPLDEERIDINSFGLSTAEARKYFGIPEKGFMIMHGGNFNYIKGSDIFAEAVKYIDPNIIVLLHRLGKSGNEDFDSKYFDLTLKNHPNTIVIDKFLDNKDYAIIHCSPDATIFSHRKVYSYGVSGIIGSVALAKRLAVVPDFYYFNEIIKRHKFGITYEPENPKAMAEAINYTMENYDRIVSVSDFEGYAKNFAPASEICLNIINQAIKRGLI